ncbi:MAG: serine--tRNA ligase [Patescibacteria group bacterium]
MLDINFIRENQELIKTAARKKHLEFDVEKLIAVDDKRRELLSSIENRRAEQNRASEKIAKANSDEERNALIGPMKSVKEAQERDETAFKEIMHKWQMLMVAVPNIPDMSVPDGENDGDNKEVRTWGEKTKFSFSQAFTPKNHIEILQNLDMLDLDRGAKVAGFRGYFLKGDAVLLQFAIWQFALKESVAKGFMPMFAPSLLKKMPFIGTGYLPQGEEDLYHTQDNDYLSGTAEVATMAYYADEVIDAKKLPVRFVSFSPCFRREAGSHGKDTKGIIRVHEFAKIEQVILSEASHEESVRLHEEITSNAEEIMQKLGIAHRVVINCGADLGLGQVKKYDIEAWVPTENTYRETHSASYFHDFQTRRLNIRYRDGDKLKFAHSLNSTVIATPRILVPLVEQFQQEDGSVLVPEVLHPYMNGVTKLSRAK